MAGGSRGIDYTKKETFQWISVIRIPEFISKKDIAWAIATAKKKKKKQDCSPVQFFDDRRRHMRTDDAHWSI